MKKALAIIIAGSMLFAFAACSKTEYTDKVVTEVVTDEKGETVTDKEGKPVTQVVTTTDVSLNAPSSAENNASSTTDKNGKEEKTSKANSGATESTTKKQPGNKPQKPTEKPTNNPAEKDTTQATTVPKKRQIKVTVKLPFDSNKEDTVVIFVDGKEVKKDKVNLNGTTYEFITEKKYRGDVEVEAKLVNYGESGKAIVVKGEDSAVINLTNIEVLQGADD